MSEPNMMNHPITSAGGAFDTTRLPDDGKDRRIAELEGEFAHEHALVERQLKRIAELEEALENYGVHCPPCPLSQWRGGRSTAAGGYEMKWGDKWYPGEEKPECTCGLGAILAKERKG